MSNLISCDTPPAPPTLMGVRAWLMEGGHPDGTDPGRPLWALAMAQGDAEAVAELLAAGANPNLRTEDGRGWLHWCADTALADWAARLPLSLLDAAWWHPDGTGRTPFHLPHLSPMLAQALGARWWAQRRSWAVLRQGPGDPEALAREAGSNGLARVWQGWARVCP